MKISEMTEDQVRDYALQLEEEKQAREEELAQAKIREQDLRDLNTALQKRNNDLFLKVEQQIVPGPEEKVQPAPTPTCEDLAHKLAKEIIK